MNAGVSSRGSPMPKSMISTPAARSRTRACSSRTKGYVASPSRTGERRTLMPSRLEAPWKGLASRAERLEHLEAAQQRADLDELLALVSLRGRARPEVD